MKPVKFLIFEAFVKMRLEKLGLCEKCTTKLITDLSLGSTSSSSVSFVLRDMTLIHRQPHFTVSSPNFQRLHKLSTLLSPCWIACVVLRTSLMLTL